MACCNDPCVSVEDLIETTIKKYIENGLISPALRSCGADAHLALNDRVVICTELASVVQTAIDNGDILTGSVTSLVLSDTTLELQTDDGEVHRVDLAPLLDLVPKITDVSVDAEGKITITLSDGNTISSNSSLKSLVYGSLKLCDGSVNGEDTTFVTCDYLSSKITQLSATLKTYVAELLRLAFQDQYHNVLTDNDTILGNGLDGGAIRINQEWLLAYINDWIKDYIPEGGTYGQILTYDKNGKPTWISVKDCEGQEINLVLQSIATCTDLKKSVPDTLSPGGVLTQDDEGNKQWAHIKDCKNQDIDINKQPMATCVDLKEAVPDGGGSGEILGKDETGKSVWFTPVDCKGNGVNLRTVSIATCSDLHALVPENGGAGQILIKDTDGNSTWASPKDCSGNNINLATQQIATCADLKEVFPDGGTEGQVLTIGPDGNPVWKNGLPDGGVAGQVLTVGADGKPVWQTINLNIEAGDGTIVEGNKVSVDREWIQKEVAKMLCGSYMECGTWIYTSNKQAIPVLDGTNLYYVSVKAADGSEKTTWFGGGNQGCYDYDVNVSASMAQFILRLNGEQTSVLETVGVGTQTPTVTVTKLKKTADEQLAGTTGYYGWRQNPDLHPIINGVQVDPMYFVHPPGGDVRTTRAQLTRWFYRVQLTNPIPAGTYTVFVQADDSLNVNMSGASHDTGLLVESQQRATQFNITTTGTTSVIYADNYNIRDVDGNNPAYFTMAIISLDGQIVFNSTDPNNPWYVSQTSLTCDNVITD